MTEWASHTRKVAVYHSTSRSEGFLFLLTAILVFHRLLHMVDGELVAYSIAGAVIVIFMWPWSVLVVLVFYRKYSDQHTCYCVNHYVLRQVFMKLNEIW